MGHHQHMRRSLSGLSFGQNGCSSSKKEVQQQQQQQLKPPPKGCMGVRVGPKEEEQERFVVPVAYLNHPLFVGLLKEAEEEYGFEHRGGAITIPCHVDHFRHVQGIIDRDITGRYAGVGEHSHGQHHHHLHFHLYACFKA